MQEDATSHGRIKTWVPGLVFLVAIPLVSHLLYGALGFSPTDEGFILAASRRLADGQIPHRDFISIRPVLSSLIHLPFLAAGSHTMWVSRGFVLFQFACICWCWVVFCRRWMKTKGSGLEQFALALIAFFISVHTFPLMAWHTVDGIWLVSLGAVCLTQSRKWQVVGMFLIGSAALTKQNYLPMGLPALVFMGLWRDWRCWAAWVLPSLLYVLVIIVAGAGDEALSQLRTQTDILVPGFWPYVTRPGFYWGLIAGAWLAIGTPRVRLFVMLGVILYPLLSIGAVQNDNPISEVLWSTHVSVYLWNPAFWIFGAGVGALIGNLIMMRLRGDFSLEALAPFALVLSLAWCASISIGYNTPVLVGGPIILVLAAFVRRNNKSANHVGVKGTLVLVALMGCVVFNHTRLNRIYEDRSAPYLTEPIGDVWPGGAKIRTNEVTYSMLADLHQSIESRPDAPYAVIPDFPGFWIKNKQPNRLPLDWPVGAEIAGNEQSLRRVIAALDDGRGTRDVYVQKYTPFFLVYARHPLFGGGYHKVVDYVRENYEQVDETEFFEIYR